ncbi:hypothetical protein L9F63_010623, partial [Diploptera punctata]
RTKVFSQRSGPAQRVTFLVAEDSFQHSAGTRRPRGEERLPLAAGEKALRPDVNDGLFVPNRTSKPRALPPPATSPATDGGASGGGRTPDQRSG